MRRSPWVGLAALVFCLAASAAGAQTDPVPTTAPPVDSSSTSVTTPSTTTTTRAATTTTTAKTSPSTTTAVARGPVPPPASGPSQTLVPDLLGGPIDVTTTTVFTPTSLTVSSVPTESRNAAPIAAHPDSPSGPMLILAGLTWLLSLAAVLVYAEDQRSLRWKHLAR